MVFWVSLAMCICRQEESHLVLQILQFRTFKEACDAGKVATCRNCRQHCLLVVDDNNSAHNYTNADIL